MIPCSVVPILAGVYATYSRWINEEVDPAKGFGEAKPIVAIALRGSDKTSALVSNADGRVVRRNSNRIVIAIRELA